MVGGKVIGIVRTSKGTLLHIEDGYDSCAIRVLEKRKDNGHTVEIQLGDKVWWQSDKLLWNSKRLTETDVPLPRIGFAH